MEVTLGKTYRDKVTGFTGVATAKHEYLNGCVQYSLEGRVKEGAEGEKPAAIGVDVQQLEAVDVPEVDVPEPARRTGGGVRHRP